MNYLILNSIKDFYAFKNNNIYKNHIIISVDTSLCFLLTKHKFNYINFWDILSKEELDFNLKEAWNISQKWHFENKIFKYILELEYSCANEEIFPSIEFLLNINTIFNKLLKTYTLSSITLLSNEFNISNFNLEDKFKLHDYIFISYVKYFSEKNNIKYNLINSINQKNIKQKLKLFYHFNFKKRSPNQVYNNIVIWSDYMPDSELQYLKNNFKNKTIVINSNIFKFNLCNDDLKFIINKYEIFLDDTIEKSKFFYDFIYNNKYLKNFFIFYLIKFLHARELCKNVVSFIKDININYFFLANDSFLKEKMIINNLKELNIKIISLFHDGFGINKDYLGVASNISDLTLVWSDHTFNTLMKFNHRNDKIIKIGSIRYQIYFDNYQNIFDNSIINVDSKIENILIVTAAIFNKINSPTASTGIHINNLILLENYINKNKNINFYFKPHPSFDDYDLYKLIEENDNVKCINGDINNILNNIDLVLMIDYFTTASVECILKNKPILFLESAIYKNELWLNPVQDFKNFRTSDINNFFLKIDSFILNPSLLNSLLISNEKFIKLALGHNYLKNNVFHDIVNNLIIRKNKLTDYKLFKNKHIELHFAIKNINYFKVFFMLLFYSNFKILKFKNSVIKYLYIIRLNN